MDKYRKFLNLEYFGNTVSNYLYAAGIFIALLLIIFIFKNVFVSRIKKITAKYQNNYSLQIAKTFNSIPSFFYYLIALYIPLKLIIHHELSLKIIDGFFTVIIIFFAVRFLQTFIEYVLSSIAAKKAGKEIGSNTAFSGIRLVISIVLWITAILLILSNLGVNITSLVASLGIGSLAIALAVQNVLKDLFSSFSIYFDKPFGIGDYITIGTKQGTVRKIGLKSTRIETLQGEELIISNNELTTSQVQNFKRMKKRRVIMNVSVLFNTPIEKLKKINEIIKNIIKNVSGTEFDKSYFKEIGIVSLNFEITYFVLSGNYSEYMKKQEEINFAILELFEKEGIELYFPSRPVVPKK